MKRATELPKLSEAEFTRQVIKLAKLYGWRVAHFRPAMTKNGWRTPVQGDGAGFPDLVLVRGSVVLWVELKVGKNYLTAEQEEWMMAIGAAGQAVYVWRPADWAEIEMALA